MTQQLELRLDVLKRVIEIRLAETQAATNAAALASREQEIIQALEAKKQQALAGASLEELEKQLAEVRAARKV